MNTRAREMFLTIFLFTVFASAQGRAVNISNTWVLPEEGFPVFYRYFRDRISWYEADAVCQFHHANLVTVDTTAQYDAVRAYLKELDISSAVWIGLIRSNPDGDFTWTDYRGLSSDGYWSSAPDAQAAPLCAAADPAADYRWEAMSCGGPTVASFICELPVPQWALGNEGCMVRALPALTVLYLPESAAVQLTADCGLAGVKKVQCTGNVKRENLLKDLSCVEEVEQTSTMNIISTVSVSSETTYTDQDAVNDTATEDIFTMNLDVDRKQQIKETTTLRSLDDQTKKVKTKSFDNLFNKIILEKSINFNLNNKDILQSNAVMKTEGNDNSLTDGSASEKHAQQQLLNAELARLGSLDTIYTQPTDHFVPPLVMAKARISDDMTVLSLEAKHAQQFSEQHLRKHDENISKPIIIKNNTDAEIESTSKPFTTTQIIDYVRKGKQNIPKKYNQKLDNPKTKLSMHLENKLKSEKLTSTTYFVETTSEPTTVISKEIDQIEEVPSIDLTVIIKEPGKNNIEKIFYSNSSSLISKTDEIPNSTEKLVPNVTEFSTNDPITTVQENQTHALENITMNHEVVKITLINNDESGTTSTFEITTKMPVFVNSEAKENNYVDTTISNMEHSTKQSVIIKSSTQTPTVEIFKETSPTIIYTKSTEVPASDKITAQVTLKVENASTSTEVPIASTSLIPNRNISEKINSSELTTMPESLLVTDQEKFDIFNYTESFTQEDHESTDTEPIDDAGSPLLSAANEPLHRPNRSRRPNQPARISKFNPFRMLG